MKETEPQVDLHCFICTNRRENGECCAQKEAKLLKQELKNYFKSSGFAVKVSESSCLGGCSEGIVAMIYPQRKKISNLDLNSKDDLIKRIEKLVAETKSTS